MKITQWLSSIGIDITLMVAGMMGSLMMISKRTSFNIKTSLISIASGTLTANYMTQVVIDFFGLEGKSQYGVAFLLGYFGLKGVETIANKMAKKKFGDGKAEDLI